MALPSSLSPPPQFLVLDDCEDDIYLFTRLLQKSGAAGIPNVFRTARGALEYLDRTLQPGSTTEPPQIAFLDVRLPGGGGLELLSQLRATPEFCHLPVVVISSAVGADDLASAARLGADVVLKKFPPPEALRAIIDTLSGPSPGDVAASPYNLLTSHASASGR